MEGHLEAESWEWWGCSLLGVVGALLGVVGALAAGNGGGARCWEWWGMSLLGGLQLRLHPDVGPLCAEAVTCPIFLELTLFLGMASRRGPSPQEHENEVCPHQKARDSEAR